MHKAVHAAALYKAPVTRYIVYGNLGILAEFIKAGVSRRRADTQVYAGGVYLAGLCLDRTAHLLNSRAARACYADVCGADKAHIAFAHNILPGACLADYFKLGTLGKGVILVIIGARAFAEVYACTCE